MFIIPILSHISTLQAIRPTWKVLPKWKKKKYLRALNEEHRRDDTCKENRDYGNCSEHVQVHLKVGSPINTSWNWNRSFRLQCRCRMDFHHRQARLLLYAVNSYIIHQTNVWFMVLIDMKWWIGTVLPCLLACSNILSICLVEVSIMQLHVYRLLIWNVHSLIDNNKDLFNVTSCTGLVDSHIWWSN